MCEYIQFMTVILLLILFFHQHVGSFILTSEELAELKMDVGFIFSRSNNGCIVVSVLPRGVD
jgi:hypothetical protein